MPQRFIMVRMVGTTTVFPARAPAAAVPVATGAAEASAPTPRVRPGPGAPIALSVRDVSKSFGGSYTFNTAIG